MFRSDGGVEFMLVGISLLVGDLTLGDAMIIKTTVCVVTWP